MISTTLMTISGYMQKEEIIIWKHAGSYCCC